MVCAAPQGGVCGGALGEVCLRVLHCHLMNISPICGAHNTSKTVLFLNKNSFERRFMFGVKELSCMMVILREDK